LVFLFSKRFESSMFSFHHITYIVSDQDRSNIARFTKPCLFKFRRTLHVNFFLQPLHHAWLHNLHATSPFIPAYKAPSLFQPKPFTSPELRKYNSFHTFQLQQTLFTNSFFYLNSLQLHHDPFLIFLNYMLQMLVVTFCSGDCKTTFKVMVSGQFMHFICSTQNKFFSFRRRRELVQHPSNQNRYKFLAAAKLYQHVNLFQHPPPSVNPCGAVITGMEEYQLSIIVF